MSKKIRKRNIALCRAMEEAGMKYEDVGERVGRSANAVWRWCTRGDRPSPDIIVKLVTLFHDKVTYSDFYV